MNPVGICGTMKACARPECTVVASHGGVGKKEM